MQRDVITIIKNQLTSSGIHAELQSRIKHLYGIYAKMRDQEIDFDEVYDIVAFRVIVGNIKDCYGSLGDNPLVMEAGSGTIQGLHRNAEAEYVPKPSHHGDRTEG